MVCVRVRDAQSIRVHAVEHNALHVHLHVLCEGKQKLHLHTGENGGTQVNISCFLMRIGEVVHGNL